MTHPAFTDPMRVQILAMEDMGDGTMRVTISADDFSTPTFTVLKEALESDGFLPMLAHGTNYQQAVTMVRRETARDRQRRKQQ